MVIKLHLASIFSLRESIWTTSKLHSALCSFHITSLKAAYRCVVGEVWWMIILIDEFKYTRNCQFDCALRAPLIWVINSSILESKRASAKQFKGCWYFLFDDVKHLETPGRNSRLYQSIESILWLMWSLKNIEENYPHYRLPCQKQLLQWPLLQQLWAQQLHFL